MFETRLVEYNSHEYREMLLLRTLILRTPLDLSFSEQELQEEINDLFIGSFRSADDLMVGCNMLTPRDEEIVQLRQMAVLEDFRGQGIGKQLLDFAEKEAELSGFSIIMMHARDVAVPFYEKMGYEKRGEPFMEVTLPHYKMKKILKKES